MTAFSIQVSSILKNLEKGGIARKEPERFLPHRHWSRGAQEDPTHIHEEQSP